MDEPEPLTENQNQITFGWEKNHPFQKRGSRKRQFDDVIPFKHAHTPINDIVDFEIKDPDERKHLLTNFGSNIIEPERNITEPIFKIEKV